MKRADYTDADGRMWAMMIPDDAPDSDAERGAVLGPPSLESLGLPAATEIRLHNELFVRGLLTPRDVRRRRADVLVALQTALRADVDRVLNCFALTADIPSP